MHGQLNVNLSQCTVTSTPNWCEKVLHFAHSFLFRYNFWGRPNLLYEVPFSYRKLNSVSVTPSLLTFSADFLSSITKHKWCYLYPTTPHIRVWSFFSARGYKFFRSTIGSSLVSTCSSISIKNQGLEFLSRQRLQIFQIDHR